MHRRRQGRPRSHRWRASGERRGLRRPGLVRRLAGRRNRATAPHVVILVQNLPVPLDRRVWKEATTLRAAGYDVTVVSPATPGFPPTREIIDGIRVRRYRQLIEGRRLFGVAVEYAVALAAQALEALLASWHADVAVVQICNPPDLLFVAAWPLKLMGAAVIFDHHDLGPELLRAKGYADRSIP